MYAEQTGEKRVNGCGSMRFDVFGTDQECFQSTLGIFLMQEPRGIDPAMTAPACTDGCLYFQGDRSMFPSNDGGWGPRAGPRSNEARGSTCGPAGYSVAQSVRQTRFWWASVTKPQLKASGLKYFTCCFQPMAARVFGTSDLSGLRLPGVGLAGGQR